MNKTLTVILLVAGSLGALTFYLQRADVGLEQTAKRGDEPALIPAEATSADITEEANTIQRDFAKESPPEQMAGNDSSIEFLSKPFGEAVVFNAGTVCDDLGNNCRVEPVTDHPYASLTDKELEGIAEYDGAAAIILAIRVARTSFDDAKPWAARGFLLTGDPYAYHMIMTYNDVRSGFTLIDGKIDTDSAKEAYLWLATGHRLGVVDASRSEYQASVLRDHGVDGIGDLDAIAQKRETLYRSKRVEMTGSDFR